MICEEKPLLTASVNKTVWNNDSNAHYYEKISMNTLRECAVKGGIQNGCDLNIIYNKYIKKSSSLIDVGAGYGRVTKNLLNSGYAGEITAIERSRNLVYYLKQLKTNRVEIICEDLRFYFPSKKTDVVLWLWSNISDFSKNEQLKIVKHLKTWIKTGGLLIMDTLSLTATPMGSAEFESQAYVYHSKAGSAYGYIPSNKEIASYALKSGFAHIEHIKYLTETNRPRVIHVLKNR